ncbi:YfcC family protein [Lactobacillus sp. 3B(2020)]|uniref:YfcC family protein n=1 Tax=Lactobacillus sp. 3B(2020) TaxID=2695882 RepID=UPI0015DF6F65|nr:YfcC family protein [Lactobacillus sp. 3B(2020)]QLL70555.1 YfcC family protein [Lactobacillus sp. 3B(2020)]
MDSTATPQKHRWRLKMPGAFTILFFLTVIAVMLTWVVPTGSYSKLQYTNNHLQVTKPSGAKESLPATQATLDKLNVKIDIQQFKSGAISKPVSIPNTYQRLKQHPASIYSIFTSMVNGTMQAVDIMIFIFVLGGTLCGIEEEAVAFYPILVPVFLAMGYDSIVCVGAIFLASSIGTTFSTINPFSVVIASNAAGTNFTQGLIGRGIGLVVAGIFVILYLHWYARKIQKDPSSSYTYEDHESFDAMWSMESDAVSPDFDWKKKVTLTLFAVAFPLMIWGVMAKGWGFPNMAASFLTIAIIIIFLNCFGKNGLGEKRVVDAFTNGSASLVGVSMIIGLARGINLVLNNGYISDTILYESTKLVQHMSGSMFIIMMMLIFFVLGFIVPSSSGLAVLAMPIMAPLADTVQIPRYVVVTAYQFGQYAMLFLAPTGLVMATLQMLDMKYSHWLRFVWPVVVFVLVFGGALLVGEVLMN